MRIFLVLCLGLLAAALPSAAEAASAPRLYVGFQDDPSFRWSPARAANLDRAAQARVSVLRTTVTWATVAPTRPASAGDPFDPTYRFDDLDELVRGAQQRNVEVLLTVWGTPGWANGGRGWNRLPTNLSDLTAFTRALASRYSGRWAGYPHVRFYSIWNESNREQFLAPQYTSGGAFVAPLHYARLYRAAYAGIKYGNSTARIAIGETASNGRNVRLGRRGVQETSSPGRFAQALGQQRPRLRFDAWAHHPYPTSSSASPAQRFAWPGVGLSNLEQFGKVLDTSFARRNTPIWITEYAHQTQGPGSVTPALQATYLAQALGLARANPRVGMFVWFVFRDEASGAWKSGVASASGAAKPSLARFRTIAAAVDARNPVLTVGAGQPTIRFSALPLAYTSPVGSLLTTSYQVWSGSRLVASGVGSSVLVRDGWFASRVPFQPAGGQSYRVSVQAVGPNGATVSRTATISRTTRGVLPTLFPLF
jgi:Cellulase (glycosyl hydrolase family 5)